MEHFIIKLIKQMKDDDLFALAAQIAFYLILSFFPFMIFLMGLLSHTELTNYSTLLSFSKLVPEEIYILLKSIIDELVNSRNDTLLSFSFLLTIWSASRGIRSISLGLNRTYDTRENRGVFFRFFYSMVYIIGLAIAIILSLILIILGSKIGYLFFSYIRLPHLFITLWNFLRYLIPIFFMLLLFTLLYRTIPNVKITIKESFPGACFTTLAYLSTTSLFSCYVDHFTNLTIVYGSITGIVMFMLWLYFISALLLIGGEINFLLKKLKKAYN